MGKQTDNDAYRGKQTDNDAYRGKQMDNDAYRGKQTDKMLLWVNKRTTMLIGGKTC